MKISEMTFDQAASAMLRLAGPMTSICDDEELSNILTEFVKRRNMPNLMAYGRMIPQLITYCLKDHKQDVYEIIEVLLGIPAAKIGAGNFVEIMKGLQDSYDEVIRSFFTRSARSPGNSATESPS